MPSRRIIVPWNVMAVDHVSLTLKKGEWIGLFGLNGSGKTTFLRLLGGLLVPDVGTIERLASISCFFELGVGFHEEHTAEENVRMHGMLQGISQQVLAEFLANVRAFADLHDHWDLPFKCYSSGMRMRLGFAVATAAPAEVLLLDEIFAVGDIKFKDRCWERLRSLKAAGISTLMVSHDLKDLQKICDRIVYMDQGRMFISVPESLLQAV